MSAAVVLRCQRTGCGAEEEIDLGTAVGPTRTACHLLPEIVSEDWPDGWAVDYVGANTVVHCPEHAT